MTTTISETFTPGELAAIDAKRGTTDRATWIHDAAVEKSGYVAPPPPTQVRRGERLGISCGALGGQRHIDAAVALGLRWVGVSYESGWSGLDTFVKAANAAGLKVHQKCQASGHSYGGGLAQVGTFGDYAVACAAAGVDAITIGNEWNNPAFWKTVSGVTQADSDPPTWQYAFAQYAATRLRAAGFKGLIGVEGCSPNGTNTDATRPFGFFPRVLKCDDAQAGQPFRAAKVVPAFHPTCYPELTTTNGYTWTPTKQTADIVKAFTDRGMPKIALWDETAFPGCPSPNTIPGYSSGVPVIRNQAITLDRQKQGYLAYFSELARNEQLGISLPIVLFATAWDGDSFTQGPEAYQGVLYRPATYNAPASDQRNWKPAAFALRDFANQLVAA